MHKTENRKVSHSIASSAKKSLPRIANGLGNLLLSRVSNRRPPDRIIGAENAEGPYLLRWHLTPWRDWREFDKENATLSDRVKSLLSRLLPNLYLHCFLRDDDDRALHDHPSFAVSFILFRGYREHTIEYGGIRTLREYLPGSLRFMGVHHTHRIELFRNHDGTPAECWTLFIFGPPIRDWGFHCEDRGWVPWQEFTKPGNPGEVGKGCD